MYEKQAKTEQTLDVYGNLTQSKVYDYGNLTTPARTYNHTYLATTNYTSRYIYNRLLTSTVTPAGGSALTLGSNSYDQFALTDRTGLREHDTTSYGTSFLYRGNVTTSTRMGVTATIGYDITGMVTGTTQGATTTSVTPVNNNAAPGTVTTGPLTSTFQYNNNFLGLTQDSEPNSAVTTLAYDAYARPSAVTSPQGASTAFSYSNSPPTNTVTTNGRWVKTTYDGLGRTIKAETGYGTTTVSIVDTVYDSCACSPLGKVKQVSQPYAPGGTVYGTTYSYDGLGRTASVAHPNASGTTTYVYAGNTVRTTDPAGKWKKNISDAMGNLVMVIEPNPAGVFDYGTTYSYNVHNQLTQVSMPRPTGTQTRTFNYDLATGRLMSAANPENGTVSYTYNSDGTVATKTDAKGIVKTFTYDSNAADPSFIQNVQGRLATLKWSNKFGCISPGEITRMFSYNAAGALTGQKLRLLRQTSFNDVTADLVASYAYDNEGKMVSTTYPNGGSTLTYAFDANLNSTQYIYSPTQNNGRITQMVASGETVDYTYDSLNRLISAVTTGPEWGLSFSYDGFGNRLSQTVTKGSAPTQSITVDSATNRVNGLSYDANGNVTSGLPIQGINPTLTYDQDNRLASVNTVPAEQYAYSPDNKRIWKKQIDGTEELYFIGVTGQKLGHYKIVVTENSQTQWSTISLTTVRTNQYFGGRFIVAVDQYGSRIPQYEDRLGSVVQHFPYGEEKPSATASGGPANPGSWNRYVYVEGDPVNAVDPSGLVTILEDLFEWGVASRGGGGGGGWDIICGDRTHFADGLPKPFICHVGLVAALPPPPARCNISVAFSGTPRDGQNLVGLVPYSPETNRLGPYTTVNRAGLAPLFRGWFFAVQIQGNLVGDTDASHWQAGQTSAISGTLQLQKLNGEVVSMPYISYNPGDEPDPRAIYRGTGRFDWLDAPGWGKYQEGGDIVVGANLTFSLTSTLTHTSGARCSVIWSVKLTVTGNNWSFER